jgi:hypothetical protein
VTLLAELTRTHRLHWIQDPQRKEGFSVVISHYAPDYTGQVEELLALLGLVAPGDRSARVLLPVSLALDGHDTGGIGITTRSVFDLLEILSGAVEVPEQDQTAGVAASYPPPGLVGRQLKVRYAAGKPAQASVAVRYRDGWFYIDETDQTTKLYFRLLSTLLSIEIAESAGRTAAPVLTLPVSR